MIAQRNQKLWRIVAAIMTQFEIVFKALGYLTKSKAQEIREQETEAINLMSLILLVNPPARKHLPYFLYRLPHLRDKRLNLH